VKKPKTLFKTRLLITSIFTLQNLESVMVGSLLLLGWIYLLRLNLIDLTNQLFIALAQAFKAGQLNLLGNPNFIDLVYYHGKIFTAHPPLPGLILVPLVYLFKNFSNQGYLFPFLNFLNFYLFYRLLKTVKTLKTNDVLWLCLAFFLASPYLFVGSFPIAWNSLLAITFLLSALLEFCTRKRSLVLGSLLALASLCRFNLFLVGIYLVADFWFEEGELKAKFKKIWRLSLPLVVVIITMFVYDWARFGDPLQTGNIYLSFASYAMPHGLFGLEYTPANLFSSLIKPPTFQLSSPFVIPPESGIGILFVSPYLLYLIKGRYSDRESKFLWGIIGVLALPILLWFSSGGSQFSFRFALDFLPFIFILLARSFKKGLPLAFKGIILVSVFCDWFLFYQYVLNLSG